MPEEAREGRVETDRAELVFDMDNSLVEKLWRDLDGRVSQERIFQAVTEIAAKYQEATVTAFVPIFVHRQALEQLRVLVPGESQPPDVVA